MNQHSTSALSSSNTPTPADASYHDGGTPSTPSAFPIQSPPPPPPTGSTNPNLSSKIIPKFLNKKDNEKDMLLINDDM